MTINFSGPYFRYTTHFLKWNFARRLHVRKQHDNELKKNHNHISHYSLNIKQQEHVHHKPPLQRN